MWSRATSIQGEIVTVSHSPPGLRCRTHPLWTQEPPVCFWKSSWIHVCDPSLHFHFVDRITPYNIKPTVLAMCFQCIVILSWTEGQWFYLQRKATWTLPYWWQNMWVECKYASFTSGDSSERQAAASLNNVKVRGRGKGLFRIVFGTQILGVSNCRSVLTLSWLRQVCTSEQNIAI